VKLNKYKITEATAVFCPRYTKLQEILQLHEKAHWGTWEIDVRKDVEQWRNGSLDEGNKNFIKMILRLFTQSDTNVCAGYVEKLLPVFKNADARMMLLSFANREVTHMLGYKFLNDSLGLDSEAFLTEFLQYKEMADKHEFMLAECDLRSNKGRAEYLAKQILMEGVNLFASFAMLLNYSRQGLVPGTVSVNQWSMVDESYHIEGLTELFKIFIEEHPSVVTMDFKQSVYETARTVVRLEDDFIDLCFSVGQPKGLDKDDLKRYIRYVADYRMQQMGFKAQFNIEKNPLPWIEDVTGKLFGDFFDVQIVEYSKGNMSGEWKY
jgi:ribonucleoside-diphosphate reductase beta chain